jgi:hypothetical protein
VQSSDQYIYKSGILDCSSDSTTNEGVESYLLQKADSLKFAESGQGFKHSLEIWGRYSFDRIPCVKMYVIWAGIPYHHSFEDPYERVLFNYCDSTIYHFGGNTNTFSSVFNTALDIDLQDDYYYELIQLYLNTLSVKGSYYLIKTKDDFRRFFDNEIEKMSHVTGVDKSAVKNRWNYDNDIKVVNGLISPMDFIRNENSVVIKVYSWASQSGDIELWWFKILPGELIVLKRELEISNVGPTAKHN